MLAPLRETSQMVILTSTRVLSKGPPPPSNTRSLGAAPSGVPWTPGCPPQLEHRVLTRAPLPVAGDCRQMTSTLETRLKTLETLRETCQSDESKHEQQLLVDKVKGLIKRLKRCQENALNPP